MASKKDFSGVNTSRVYSAIEQATAAAPAPTRKRATPTAEQIADAHSTGETQGKAGCGYKRINMAFYDDVHEFITVMARVRGETMTQFVNHLIRDYAEQNADIYEQAKIFKNSL